MSTWQVMYLDSLRNPPPKDEPLPLANKKATMLGITLTFLVVAWFAVIFRFYVRIKIVKKFGWDDAFVLVAQLYYLEVALYVTNCGIIKLALLFQYLRIFRAGRMRIVCIGLLVVVALWCIGFSITAWFPCFPVAGYWDRALNPRCYGFGFGNLDGFVNIYTAQAATNMVLDMAIFLTPMILFRTPNLRLKNVMAMAGVFAFGAVVVGTSVYRLHGIITTRGATYPYVDWTWWTPILIVLSCSEIDLAVICASMPIFWPILEKSFNSIFVSYEVQVVEERILDYGAQYELEHTKTLEKERTGTSIKSDGTSTRELTYDDDDDAHTRVVVPPQFTVGADPTYEQIASQGFVTNIETKRPPKWQL
ncbi:integral membrane [Pyrenophora seminiperda CCB06]|uniref:Integral membrane n=1 Tax=Pyrenophora seminiperda CCB06 TaxID=1302712 RepID=A0A3M7LVN4_9PLEO|nr:integral membrane [Pyrenophora seminiperda CCB06]